MPSPEPWVHASIEWCGLLPAAGGAPSKPAGATHLVTWPATEFDPSDTDCFTAGNQIWIWQPQVGAVRFSLDEPHLVALRWPDADPADFRQIVTRSWLPAIYPLWGRQVLHASGIVCPLTGEAVAFTGTTHAGKSTTAYGVSRNSQWQILADDTIAFTLTPEGARLFPLPNESRLRPASAAYYGVEPFTREPLSWPAYPVTLRALYVLEGDESASPTAEFTPLRAADAIPSLLQQAFTLSFELPKYNQQLMKDYVALATTVRVFKLRYRRSFDVADELFGAIREHLSHDVGLSCPAADPVRLDS